MVFNGDEQRKFYKQSCYDQQFSYNQKTQYSGGLFDRMLQPQPHDQSNLSESQIYDDLSQIIKSFKNILTSMENISASLYRYEPIICLNQQLKDTMKSLQAYVKVYSTPIDNHSEHKNTFHRFICRLIESVSAYKLKFQSLPYFNMLAQDINDIEYSIVSYQHDKNIGSVIKKMQIIINRFCAKTLKKSQSYTKFSEIQNSSVSPERGSQLPAISNEYQMNEKMNILSLNPQVKQKKVVESKSQNSLNKMMNLLNRRFKTIACLDIEYHEFKYLFFRSRDSKQELFEDCLQRNGFIYREMLRYSRQFSQYLQRKELKLFRKNKFVDSLVNQHIKVKPKPYHKTDHPQETSYNFTKKKPINEPRKTVALGHFLPAEIHQSHSPNLLSRSQFLDQKSSNLISIEHQQNGHFTPQMKDKERLKKIAILRDFNDRDKFQELNAQTLLEFSKRKKNLQLKKIDISLTSFSNAGEVQTAKMKSKLLNAEIFKKTQTQTSKQIEQKISTSVRKNYIQKKYQQAMKKNIEQSVLDIGEAQKTQNASSSKYSSVKCIQPDDQESPNHISRQKKYLFKTSNKRSVNTVGQFNSLNTANQRKEVSTIKNFRKIKIDQVDKIQKLQKMKQMALNHMQISSGGRAIRPAFIYRPKELTQNLYTEVAEQDFSDTKLGSHKELEMGQKLYQ